MIHLLADSEAWSAKDSVHLITALTGLITAIGGMIAGVAAFFRSGVNSAKIDANKTAISEHQESLRRTNDRLSAVALATPPPTEQPTKAGPTSTFP